MTLSALTEKKQRNNIEVQRRKTISRWPRNLNQKSGVLRKKSYQMEVNLEVDLIHSEFI